jgi:ammonia channel protein AmtB
VVGDNNRHYVHGRHVTDGLCRLGGIIGAFLTGLFSQKSLNAAGADGAFYGRPIQMWYQIVGILTGIGKWRLSKEYSGRCDIAVGVVGFAAGCTAGILLPLNWIMGIRTAEEDELKGLDAAGRMIVLPF